MTVLITLSLILNGYLFGFKFFHNCPFVVLFSYFTLFGFSLSVIALFLSSLVSNLKMGYSLAFAVLLTSLIMEIMFADPNTIWLFFL